MEDGLQVYHRRTEPGVHRICFDERPCQLLGEVVTPLPMRPGHPKKVDYEYKRHGTGVVLLAYDIDRGQRYCQVRSQRTKPEYAQFMDWLRQTHYPEAHRILVVQDNLNTHTQGAFYEQLPCERAFQLSQRLEFHFTPKHASWLNMAEIEFAALTRQCLGERIGLPSQLEQQVLAWQEKRNQAGVRIHWTFTVDNARQKLQRHYQSVCSKN